MHLAITYQLDPTGNDVSAPINKEILEHKEWKVVCINTTFIQKQFGGMLQLSTVVYDVPETEHPLLQPTKPALVTTLAKA